MPTRFCAFPDLIENTVKVELFGCFFRHLFNSTVFVAAAGPNPAPATIPYAPVGHAILHRDIIGQALSQAAVKSGERENHRSAFQFALQGLFHRFLVINGPH